LQLNLGSKLDQHVGTEKGANAAAAPQSMVPAAPTSHGVAPGGVLQAFVLVPGSELYRRKSGDYIPTDETENRQTDRARRDVSDTI
jgi:hypothetical protein